MLALPASFVAHATDAAATAYAQVAGIADGPVPARWRNYALASITPRFAWAQQTPASEPRVQDFAADTASIAFVLSQLGGQSQATINLSISSSVIDDRAPVLSRPALNAEADLPRIGLRRQVIAPSYVGYWGNSGSFAVTAILAQQRFASMGMGTHALHDAAPIWAGPGAETSYGAGARLDSGHALTDRLSWNAGYQTRVNMDAFKHYRGVYAEPGQFDIPANASFGLSYAVTPALSFDLGVQRVMYSGVKPFTSSALPSRFLALLGTGASPVFAWQDLDVYSAGWTLRNATLGELELRYTTRQQPSPTSALLDLALGIDPSDYSIGMGWSRSTGARSNLSLQSVYSTAPYFMGVPSYRTRDHASKGDSVEFEARWAMRF